MRRKGRIADFESEIYRRDGSILWISENARAVHDEVTVSFSITREWCRTSRAENPRRSAETGGRGPCPLRRGIADQECPWRPRAECSSSASIMYWRY
jgi:hypothetical protein